MTLEELIKKEGIESLRSKLQELVSNKVTDDVVEFTIEDEGYYVGFVAAFPQDDGKYVVSHMTYEDEVDDDNYIDSILECHAEELWEAYCDLGDEFDLHQSNYVRKINNQ